MMTASASYRGKEAPDHLGVGGFRLPKERNMEKKIGVCPVDGVEFSPRRRGAKEQRTCSRRCSAELRERDRVVVLKAEWPSCREPGCLRPSRRRISKNTGLSGYCDKHYQQRTRPACPE